MHVKKYTTASHHAPHHAPCHASHHASRHCITPCITPLHHRTMHHTTASLYQCTTASVYHCITETEPLDVRSPFRGFCVGGKTDNIKHFLWFENKIAAVGTTISIEWVCPLKFSVKFWKLIPKLKSKIFGDPIDSRQWRSSAYHIHSIDFHFFTLKTDVKKRTKWGQWYF